MVTADQLGGKQGPFDGYAGWKAPTRTDSSSALVGISDSDFDEYVNSRQDFSKGERQHRLPTKDEVLSWLVVLGVPAAIALLASAR